MVNKLCHIVFKSDKVHYEWLAAIPLWHFLWRQMKPFQYYEFNASDPNWNEIRGGLPLEDLTNWFKVIDTTSGYECTCICQVNILILL